MTDTEAMDRRVAVLLDGQMPRVWSLLVTVFGDLVQADDAQVSGRTLGRITEAIGLRPQAVRVALHRLRKESWIETARRGRESLYGLSGLGRSESEAARPFIYGAAPTLEDCRLVLVEPGIEVASGTTLTAEIALVMGGNEAGYALGLPKELPGWLRARVCDAALVAASEEAHARFEALLSDLTAAPADTALERAVLRVLVVHLWRRVVLRAPRLPDEVFPLGWRGEECRALFAQVLDALPRPALSELDARSEGSRAA